MRSVRDHYERHLGALYGWMQGGVEPALSRGRAELDAIGIEPVTQGKAIDLDAGFGMHAIPLAQRGFTVVAIDSNPQLLQELATRRGSLPIAVVEDDLLAFTDHLDGAADLILCMGDTLTHLTDRTAVQALARCAADSLRPGGTFVATFRDYSVPLTETARFIPVKGDDQRLMTCFLEYFPDHVHVHDLVHERTEEGWALRASAYRKLRLAPDWVSGVLVAAGFAVRADKTPSGMTRLIGRRSSP